MPPSTLSNIPNDVTSMPNGRTNVLQRVLEPFQSSGFNFLHSSCLLPSTPQSDITLISGGRANSQTGVGVAAVPLADIDSIAIPYLPNVPEHFPLQLKQDGDAPYHETDSVVSNNQQLSSVALVADRVTNLLQKLSVNQEDSRSTVNHQSGEWLGDDPAILSIAETAGIANKTTSPPPCSMSDSMSQFKRSNSTAGGPFSGRAAADIIKDHSVRSDHHALAASKKTLSDCLIALSPISKPDRAYQIS
ncbi:unnamed protein product, partial [Protopolystoma xenopodis]